MSVKKIATTATAFRQRAVSFPDARSAFRYWLTSLQLAPADVVLLPAYIGWSSREGSGVFDPVRQLSLRHAFYPVDRSLHIDVDAFERALTAGPVRAAVLIHYFGVPDPNAA